MTDYGTTPESGTEIGSSLRRRAWNIAIVLWVVSFLVAMTATTVADPDLWGHVRFGLDILEKGTVIQTDVYSYVTNGHTWINHEWLSELTFALAWNFGGAPALIWLKTAVFMLTFAVVYWHLRYIKVTPLRAGILVIILFEVLMPFVAALRPYVFTALFFAVLLHLIWRADSGHYRSLWLAPPIMVLWVNLHGGFLAGIGVLVLWVVSHILIRRRGFLELLPPIACSLAASLVNPYGADLPLFLIRTATVARPEITDWSPLRWNSTLGLVDLALLALALIALAASRSKRRPALILVFAITSAMPFIAVRHILLSAIGTVMLVGEHIADAIDRLPGQGNRNAQIRPWFAIVPALLSVAIVVGRSDSFCRITLPEDFYPVKAVRLIRQSGVQGNIAAHFAWGEYTIWHLGPAVKVAADGRRETVYPPDAYEKFLRFQYGSDDWEALLRDYPTDMALVQKNSAIYRLMSSKNGWSLAYEDSISAIFVLKKVTLAKLLQTVPQTTIEVPAFP